jgi:cystathionine gamma-synthase
VHAGEPIAQVGGPVVSPIVLSSTYFSEPSGEGEVRYQRYFNGPNHVALAERLAALEGSEDAFVFASGMSAMACALISLLQAGDHVLATDAIYGGTRALLDRELSRFGIETTYVDFGGTGWESGFRENTRVVLGETPSNPLLRVMDLPAVAAAAHARGAAFVVDATFASPYNLRAIEHGVDLVMHSGTKYLGGHSDVLGGALVFGARSDWQNAIAHRRHITGAVAAPFNSWLVLRGCRSLHARMAMHCANARRVAEFLAAQPGVAVVHYPGLDSHPQHAIAARQMADFGAMLSFRPHGGRDAALALAGALELVINATSLGGPESLIEHRASVEGPVPHSAPDLLRVSVGLEHPDDLIADFRRALAVLGAR